MEYDFVNERALCVGFLRGDENTRKLLDSILEFGDLRGNKFRMIFEAARKCHHENLEIDVHSVAMNCNGDYGGMEFLSKLFEIDLPTNMMAHIDRQKRKSVHTKIRDDLLPRLDKLLQDSEQHPMEFFSEIESYSKQFDLGFEKRGKFSNDYLEYFRSRVSGELMTFRSIGYDEVDEVLESGFAPGRLSLVAARTSNGKSSWLVDCVARLICQKENVFKKCVIPLEVGRMSFLDRLASRLTLIPSRKVGKRAKDLTLVEREELRFVIEQADSENFDVLEDPFRIDDRTNDRSLDRLEELVVRRGYEWVAIDLFQRLLSDLRPQSIELALSRVQEMAKRHQCHFTLFHQINRLAEDRDDKRPKLRDLKGSGGYEEYPDLILLLHRPKTYKTYSLREDTMEVKIAKQRDGLANMSFKYLFQPSVCLLDTLGVLDEKTKNKNKKTFKKTD